MRQSGTYILPRLPRLLHLPCAAVPRPIFLTLNGYITRTFVSAAMPCPIAHLVAVARVCMTRPGRLEGTRASAQMGRFAGLHFAKTKSTSTWLVSIAMRSTHEKPRTCLFTRSQEYAKALASFVQSHVVSPSSVTSPTPKAFTKVGTVGKTHDHQLLLHFVCVCVCVCVYFMRCDIYTYILCLCICR